MCLPCEFGFAGQGMPVADLLRQPDGAHAANLRPVLAVVLIMANFILRIGSWL
jgi:hypothetical protein